MQNSPDSRIAGAAQKYIEMRQDASDGTDAKEKLVEQWLAYCMYRSAARLSEGGSKVHLMYWNRKPLIEKLGSGTIDVAAALFGNGEASQMYDNVINKDLSEVLQTLLRKFMNGEALQLYQNEIIGVDTFNWDPFPKALFVTDEKFQCDVIERMG